MKGEVEKTLLMNKIDEQLEKIKQEKRLGLMTHVVVGYPSLEETVSLVKTMASSGADFVELQIPFSDPLADGPTIMKACEDSLKKGTKVKDAFEIAKKLSGQTSTPLLFMAYFNTVFKYGLAKFCTDAKRVGISGLIIPDIPMEEQEYSELINYCNKNGLYLIKVLSPVSTEERIKKNSLNAKGFVYCTARQGITGTQKGFDRQTLKYLETVKKYFKIPIALGFGISKREHLASIEGKAEIAVVGSAILDIISKAGDSYLSRVEKFLLGLRN